MFELPFPSDGYVLVHEPPKAKEKHSAPSLQVIQLNLVEEITKDLLKCLRNNEQVRLKLGKKPCIQTTRKSHPLSHGTEAFPTEVFSTAANDKEHIYFSGKLGHLLEVEEANKAIAATDDALTNLQNSIKSIKESKASNEASFVRKTEELWKRDNRPPALTGRERFFGSPAPSSPYLNAGFSPRTGPTSAPLLGPGSSKDKIRLDAIRIPMVHLLAVGPTTAQAIAEKLQVNKEDCEKVLEKVARDAKGGVGRRELKERSYRELDVWKFPYPSQGDRQSAIDHAVHAYDRMRIEKSDPLWQLLLAKEDRGKGIYLSKLNFDKPLPTTGGHSTPRPGQTTDGSTEGKSSLGEVSDAGREVKGKKLNPPLSTLRESGKTSKVSNDLPAKLKATKAKPIKEASKPPARSTKEIAKFKSSERIDNSDEEAASTPVVVAKAVSGPAKRKEVGTSNSKATNSPNIAPAISAKVSPHKTKPPNTSTSNNDNETTSSKSRRPIIHARSREMSTNSQNSPRPRTGSSPQKPSPLGSSPPTNSTDADGSSTSKASSQSSAPSSPPSSTDLSDLKKKTEYSPILAEKRSTVNMSATATKRKAETTNGQPAAKRQQTNGNSLNALPKGLTDTLQRPDLRRQTSTTESLSSPDKPWPDRAEIIENARLFNKYYTKYKNLHEKLNTIQPKDRDDKDLENLWKMHGRLGEMKAEIWEDWERLEGQK